MALAPAERQRRYRASHVMVPRQQEPGEPVPAPPSEKKRLDLDAVNAAMWTMMDAYNHPAGTASDLRQQVWALGRVVHELVLVLNESSHSP